MRELTGCTHASLDLVETLNVLGREMHLLSVFARGCHVVERGSQRGLLLDKVSIKINEAEEQL